MLATVAERSSPRSTRSKAANLRQLTKHNDKLLGELQLATTEDFQSKSKDGTEVHGLIVKPAGYKAGTKYPTLLIVHGGPNGQDQHSFSFDRELLAANGYVVLAINYRGSAGRGNAWQKAIHGDWGNLEVVDLLGAVDEAVQAGDCRSGSPRHRRLELRRHLHQLHDRHRHALQGGDQRRRQLDAVHDVRRWINTSSSTTRSWGSRGRTKDKWMKVSYPFFNADKIKTPTLFMGGEKDFNVPIAGGEQMYQALKSLGVDTQLVIYPGQFHGLTIPSYERDRLQRYVNWFNKYLQPTTTTTASPAAVSRMPSFE